MVPNAQSYSRFSGPNFPQIFEEILVHLLFLAAGSFLQSCDCDLVINIQTDFNSFSVYNSDHNFEQNLAHNLIKEIGV